MVETARLQDRSTPLSTCMGLRPKSSQRTRTQSLEASVEWSFRGRPILVATSWLPHQLWFTPNNSRENTAGLTEAVAVHLPRPLRGSPRIGHINYLLVAMETNMFLCFRDYGAHNLPSEKDMAKRHGSRTSLSFI